MPGFVISITYICFEPYYSTPEKTYIRLNIPLRHIVYYSLIFNPLTPAIYHIEAIFKNFKRMIIENKIRRNQTKTLCDLFKYRVDNTPKDVAYTWFDEAKQNWQKITWLGVYQRFLEVRNALSEENLQPDDRIIIALPNGIEWIILEQAAMFLGLVVIALPHTESTANIHHIMDDTNAKLVFIKKGSDRHAIACYAESRDHQVKIIALEHQSHLSNDSVDLTFANWTKKTKLYQAKHAVINENTLATIIYTSGTTGKPKGVMHTHKSLLNNAFACIQKININRTDTLLSVTPLAYIMERIAGYYVPMIVGGSVTYGQGAGEILSDLKQSRASFLVTTPYILDCAFQCLMNNHATLQKTIAGYIDYQNGVSKFQLKFLLWPVLQKLLARTIKKEYLGNLKQIFCGGANLSGEVIALSKLLDIPLMQGYGLTEAGGIVSVNTKDHNQPYSMGTSLSNVTLHFAEDNEIIIKSNSLMSGYWQDKQLSKKMLLNHTLYTGDIGYFDKDFLFMTGRKSQMIILTNGRKISPQAIEAKILADRLFKNVLLYGDNQEKLTLICQLCEKAWPEFIEKYLPANKKSDEQTHALLSVRINTTLKSIPGHHHIDFVLPSFEQWSANNGLLNAQGKVIRNNVYRYYADELKAIYNG